MTSVALHEIVVDDEIYPRAAWSQTTVDRYTDAMQAGEMFPPIILESGTNRLLDGMHRTEAFRAVGRDLVPVDYHEIPDGIPAKLYAASLSSRHGDPLGSEDKRQVARETATSNPDFSMVLIAKLLGTTRQTVSKYVGDIAERRRDVRKAKALLLKRSGLSMQQIADELAVGKATAVEDVNADISDRLTDDVLREAAADLPIDVEPLISAIQAERTPAPSGEACAHGRLKASCEWCSPTPTPGSSDAAVNPPVGPGATLAPAVESPRTVVPPQEPDPAPPTAQPSQALADMAAAEQADSVRRVRVRNLTSVLTFLTPLAITPAELAEREYGPVLDEFKQDDLERALDTLTTIVSLKRGM